MRQGESEAAAGPDGVDVDAILARAGLRRTQQRLALARLLFGSGHRHVSAEQLYAEAAAAGLGVSLATVYNMLNHCMLAGLVREIPLGGHISLYDTNVSDHCHFYLDSEGALADTSEGAVVVGTVAPPAGYTVVHIDVIAHLARRSLQPKR